MAPAPQRRLSAILFADVYGYSRLVALDEESTVARLQRGIALFRQLISDYGGRIVDTAGDGIFATFESAFEAVRFAVEIQREFKEAMAWGDQQRPLRFRIGVHLGEVLVDDVHVHGHHVNIAARIEDLAAPGGICISDTVRKALPRDYPIRLRSLGRPHLKNLGKLVEVFEVEEPPSSGNLLLAAPDDHRLLVIGANEITVAVLPLENLTGDLANLHICHGLTADLISNLTRFRDLSVIAPHSSFVLQAMNLAPDEIAQRLGARYIVSGSWQQTGTRIRIRARLAEAETGRVLWAEHYDGDLREIFIFLDDVTSTVAARLAIQISAAERRRLEEKYVPSIEAYGLILRGVDLAMRHSREGILHARRLFEQASEIEPAYGRSYAGMSRTLNLAWRYRWADDPDRCLDQAVDLAHRAIEHDELDARGFSELGFASLYRREHDVALASYAQAVKLNPNDADILAEYGDALVYDGRPEESLDHIQRAMKLNPYHPDWYLWALGDANFYLGNYAGTIAALKRMRNPAEAHRLLAASYAHLGDLEQARHHASQVMATHPNFSIEHWKRVPPHRDPSRLDRLIDGLRSAGLR